jgi:hypothetical protein
MKASGMNFHQKRECVRLTTKGNSPAMISNHISVEQWAVTAYLNRLANKRTTAKAEAREVVAEVAAPIEAEAYDSDAALDAAIADHDERAPSKPKPVSASDEHGPLPQSADWDTLTPQQRGALTRRRNAAALAAS